MEQSFCQFVEEIRKDPTKQLSLKVRDYLGLKAHVETCQTCSDTVDAIIEEGKDRPSDNTDWEKSRYN